MGLGRVGPGLGRAGSLTATDSFEWRLRRTLVGVVEPHAGRVALALRTTTVRWGVGIQKAVQSLVLPSFLHFLWGGVDSF